jgi:hypothetical protein
VSIFDETTTCADAAVAERDKASIKPANLVVSDIGTSLVSWNRPQCRRV